jgi:hypothetical protein
MHPIDVADLTVAAVDDNATAPLKDASGTPAPHSVEQRFPERIGTGRFRDAMAADIRQGREVIGNAVGDEVERIASVSEERGKGMVGPIHTAGGDEVSGDKNVRGHLEFACELEVSAVGARTAAEYSKAFSSQNSIPPWLKKIG